MFFLVKYCNQSTILSCDKVTILSQQKLWLLPEQCFIMKRIRYDKKNCYVIRLYLLNVLIVNNMETGNYFQNY